MDSNLLLIMIVGLVLIFIGGIVLSLVIGQAQNRKQRAMEVITGKAGVSIKEDSKEKSMVKQRAEIARKLKEAGDEDKKKQDGKSLREMIQQAGFEISVERFWVYSGIFGLFFWLILMLLTSFSTITVFALTFTAFIGLPRMFLKIKSGRRQRKFLEEFPDALEAMVRLLQAGMPVGEAIAMVASEYSGPVAEEMSRVYDDQKVGISMGEAAERAAKRMPITEMQMFATAIQIQTETGSSLSEVLSNLAEVIRSRFRLQRKVKALSSEAKASAAIIGALPVLVAGGLYAVNPDYISLLFTTPKGKLLISGAIIWMSFGMFIMKQMINFKV